MYLPILKNVTLQQRTNYEPSPLGTMMKFIFLLSISVTGGVVISESIKLEQLRTSPLVVTIETEDSLEWTIKNKGCLDQINSHSVGKQTLCTCRCAYSINATLIKKNQKKKNSGTSLSHSSKATT